MFRLSQIKLWRNISITIFLIAIIFTIIGAFTIRGDLIVHRSSAGVPNSSSGKWILWVMLLLAFLSMFTHSSVSKKRPGQNPLSLEMAGAFSSGLVAMWTIVIIVLVVYNSYPILAIPIIGTIAIIFCYVLFIVIAHIREKKSGKY